MLLHYFLLTVASCAPQSSGGQSQQQTPDATKYFNGQITVKDTSVKDYIQGAQDLSKANEKAQQKAQELDIPKDEQLIYFVPVNNAYEGTRAPFFKLVEKNDELAKALVLYNISPMPKEGFAGMEKPQGSSGSGSSGSSSMNILDSLSKLKGPVSAPTLLEGFNHKIAVYKAGLQSAKSKSQWSQSSQSAQGSDSEGQQNEKPLLLIDNGAVLRVVKCKDGVVVVTDKLLVPWGAEQAEDLGEEDSQQQYPTSGGSQTSQTSSPSPTVTSRNMQKAEASSAIASATSIAKAEGSSAAPTATSNAKAESAPPSSASQSAAPKSTSQ